MQFGRIGKQNFNMDVAFPYSIFQAFGIALSSFDFKFACEWNNINISLGHIYRFNIYKLILFIHSHIAY
jgi:hypothetical protein